MIINATEIDYEKIAKQRYEEEEKLIDSILKQCTENNCIEDYHISTKKSKKSKESKELRGQYFTHHKIQSGLHVYTMKYGEESDIYDSWKSPYRDHRGRYTKDSIVYSIIVPDEADSEIIQKCIKDGNNPRPEITYYQSAIVFENSSNCSKIAYVIDEVDNPYDGYIGTVKVEIIKDKKETMPNCSFYQNTQYVDFANIDLNGLITI